jgi:DNA-binding NarL/FixJ family response regulator
MTTVAIVEDNSTVRQTLREWIDGAAGCRCVCACATSKEALGAIPRHSPDVALMDINLPGGETGIACTARLKQLLPRLQLIILTVYKDHDLIFQALQAGACGYLLKRSSREEILRAIAEVQTGGAPMTGEIARMLVETFQKPLPRQPEGGLSPREMEILLLVARGLANKEIAARLNISFDTVRNHLRHTYEKLHVRCRAEAVMKYIDAGGSVKPSPGALSAGRR